MAKITKAAGKAEKAKGKRGRPPIAKGKVLTAGEKARRYRAQRSSRKAATQRRKARDRMNEQYAREHNLEPKSTSDACKARQQHNKENYVAMRAFVRATKREIKAVRARNAELEEEIETIDQKWRVHDVDIRLAEQHRLNYKLEMIR